MPRTPRIPSYRLHKSSGQAVVTLAGRDRYLGTHGSPESKLEYERLVAEWLASGRSAAPRTKDISVGEILDAYLRWAQGYYRKPDLDTGKLVATPQLSRVRRALSAVRELYGHTEGREFGPLALKAVRQRLVDQRLARTEANQLVKTIKHIFKWAVAEELLPPAVHEGLRCVEGLKFGRCDARETEPVKPVPEEHIPPVQAAVLPVVGDVIALQLLTAARPGELLELRPAELDRSGDVWLYRPRSHKNRHRGHDRTIYFGPRAQRILNPYLDRQPDAYCFSPREAMLAELQLRGRKARTNAKGKYSPSAYVRAIREACDRLGIPRWRPYRLRHNAATRLVAEFGWDAARIILGHRCLQATRIYAEDADRKAVEVASKAG